MFYSAIFSTLISSLLVEAITTTIPLGLYKIADMTGGGTCVHTETYFPQPCARITGDANTQVNMVSVSCDESITATTSPFLLSVALSSNGQSYRQAGEFGMQLYLDSQTGKWTAYQATPMWQCTYPLDFVKSDVATPVSSGSPAPTGISSNTQKNSSVQGVARMTVAMLWVTLMVLQF